MRYVYGGLRIASELAFARLTPADPADAGAADLEVHVADCAAAPGRGRKLYQWPGRFEMSLWSDGADWVFHSARMGLDVALSADGRTLRCHPQGADADSLCEFVIRRVLPRAAHLHGRLTTHAALVQGPHGCLMLAGPSGAGKSTLSTALGLMAGWRQLSDDISILAADGRGAWASAPGAYLTPTSRAGLGLDAGEGGGDPSHSGKAWFGVGALASEPAPIAGLVFLHRRDDVRAPRLTQLSRAEALHALIPQFIRFNPSDPAAEARLFQSFAAAIGGFGGYLLEYPSDYAALPAVGVELRRAGALARV